MFRQRHLTLQSTGTAKSRAFGSPRLRLGAPYFYVRSCSSGTKLDDTLHCSYIKAMNTLHFEWDENKSSSNLTKHGISFDEAKSVFHDDRAKLIADPDHSENEDRFILLGLSSNLRLLVVCHCYRTENNVIRIISARKATNTEASFYR